DARERNAAGQAFCVEKENRARRAIRPDDALVFFDGKQQGGKSFIERRGGDDPGMTEDLAKEPFFDGASGSDRCGQGQLFGAIGALTGDSRNIQHTGKPARRIEDGRAGAGEPAVAGAIMLAAMNQYGALFGDAGSDAVGAFDGLGPDAAQPDAPV